MGYIITLRALDFQIQLEHLLLQTHFDESTHKGLKLCLGTDQHELSAPRRDSFDRTRETETIDFGFEEVSEPPRRGERGKCPIDFIQHQGENIG